MANEERILRLENAFSTLVELARTQSERMDEYERRTEELAGAQTELTGAQKDLTETMKEVAEALKQIAEAQRQTKEAQRQTAEAQRQTEANLSALTIIVSDLGRAQAQTERAMTSLTQRFDQHIGGSG